MAKAIAYLYSSKDQGVQLYIANRLFTFPDASVDFFLPQLCIMFVYMSDVAEAIQPYLLTK